MKKLFILCLCLAFVGLANAQVQIFNFGPVDYGNYNTNCRVIYGFNNVTVGETLTAKVYAVQTQQTITLETFVLQAGDTIANQPAGDFYKTVLVDQLPPGITFPAEVIFTLTDGQGNTSVWDTVTFTNNPSSLELRKPTGGTYTQNWFINYEIWNLYLPNEVTIEYAPWGTTNYTTLAVTQSYGYYTSIPTPGTYSLRVRNLQFMDSVLINIIPDSPGFLDIISPQIGDFYAPQVFDTIKVLCNTGSSYDARLLDSNNVPIAEIPLNYPSDDFPGTNGIVWTFIPGYVDPDSVECDNCKLVVYDSYNPQTGLSDTIGNLSIHTNSIEGRVYYDYNNNGVYDTGDAPYSSPTIGVSPLQGPIYSYSNGKYKYRTAQNGTFTLTPPVVTACPNQILPATQTITLNAANSDVSNIDFRIVPTNAPYDMSVLMLNSTIAIIGSAPTVMVITNNGGTISPAGTLTLSFDGTLQQYVPSAGDTLPISQTANSLTFNVPPLQPCANYVIITRVAATAPAGTYILNTMQFAGYPNDGDTTNNIAYVELFVVAAYDPNDKQVDKKVIYTPELTATDKLVYTIRFQNTGDAPAYNIKVVDTLAANINPATFEAVTSSHAYNLVYRQESNVLEFRFPNIQLIDSTTDEPNSHGYVTFTVARPDGLIAGDVIENFVDIYFDYNEPVRTNTAVTQILEPLSVAENGAEVFTLFPNPAKGFVQIKMKENTTGKTVVMLYSAEGKLLQSNTHYVQGTGLIIQDISKLANGVYYIAITTAQGLQSTKKVVVIN